MSARKVQAKPATRLTDAWLLNEAALAFHAALTKHGHKTRQVAKINGPRSEFYVSFLAPTSMKGWRRNVEPGMDMLARAVKRARLARLTTLIPGMSLSTRYTFATSKRLGVALTGVRSYSIRTDEETFTIYVKGRT